MAVTSMANSSIRDFTKFNTMATTFTSAPFNVRFLTVAGGGGSNGIFQPCGAGGAGGLITNTETLTKGTYGVTVGAGASGRTQGSNSLFHINTAVGGGAGGLSDNGMGPGGGDGAAGGSGGGGGSSNVNLTYPGGAATAGQGNVGGNGQASINSLIRFSGGGGGAGGAGENGTTAGHGGDGGVGLQSDITGSNVYYAGGGGGSAHTGSAGVGGLGGGGNGGFGTSATGGDVNTGGGAGANGGSGAIGPENGGSGVVIISLPVQAFVTFSAGVTQTSAVVGINRVYTVTATSTTSETVTIS